MQENRLLNWLTTRGISNDVIGLFNITTYQHREMGECIRIPVNEGGLAKYRRDYEQNIKPKYTADYGLKASLYGWSLAKVHKRILITEGELDTLVAWSHNIPAVSSTAGSKTFTDEWIEWLKEKDVTLCFDNDRAGAEGMVNIIKRLPQAKVVLIPQRPNIKDLTDYIQYGGNIHELLKTAKVYESVEQVKEDRSAKVSVFESTVFHDEYLNEMEVKAVPNSRPVTAKDNSDKELAKTYPISNLIDFDSKKACCIWHNESTPSLTYYPKTNSVYCFGCGKYGDVIDVYREVHNCDFKTAVTELKKLI